ncbi:MAG: aminotransferase class I/II-fold pyridoxal phosphate-dependent enzyme [Planctomycetota bacterium]|jgi:histidinol-phosphate aminotransferase
MIRPRDTVEQCDPYRPPLEGRRSFIRLDFNENTTGCIQALSGLPDAFAATYPEYEGLLKALGDVLGLPVENLLPTNGSGEALFLTAFTFIEPGTDRALTSRPTFALIPHSLRLVGSKLLEIPVTEDLDFDVNGIEKALENGPKLAVFASPDNPTGAVLDPERVRAWCRRFPRTLFLMDEAYGEYAEFSLLPTSGSLVNLLVLRTFSKAWGLAGLRIGVLAGHPTLLESLAKVKSPFSVNAAAVSAVERMLPRFDEVRTQARHTLERKSSLLATLAELGFETVPGKANFFLLHLGPEAGTFCAFARSQGILVRDRSTLPSLEGWIRVTVGTASENRAFTACLGEFRRTRGLIFDLDDTLVDTSRSYDAVVEALVLGFTGSSPRRGGLGQIRSEGGFNDDWDAATEMVRRCGIEIPRSRIEEMGKALYLARARETENLFVSDEGLRRLGRRYRLFLLTGRPRDEYAPVWGEVLDPLFERVVCRNEPPGFPPKPAPDQLRNLMEEEGLAGGVYIGNSVDDMMAAKDAGLTPLAVSTTLDELALRTAGAEEVFSSPAHIEEVFLP